MKHIVWKSPSNDPFDNHLVHLDIDDGCPTLEDKDRAPDKAKDQTCAVTNF